MSDSVNRRAAIVAFAALAAAPALPRTAAALSASEAGALIGRAVAEINGVIASGRSERQMYGAFEGIFARYADVPTIARTTLGPAARGASRADLRAYTQAFQGYIARKYGSRFRDFIGGKIEVTGARPVKSFHEVRATARLRGRAPLDVVFLVSDRSGQNLFFDLLVEGVSLLKAERSEIGAMLDRRRGDVGALAADLARAG